MDLVDKQVLLVEDEAVIALTEKLWLQREGLKVRHVVSGEDAIRVVNENPDSIDIIIMDIDLGRGIDGTEAAGIILDSHDIPILFLSSHTEKSIVRLTEEITNYGYVVKGSGETVLVASIKMALKLHKSQKESRIHEMWLHQVEERLRFALEGTNDGLWDVNIKTGEVYLSPRGCEILGYAADELPEIAKVWSDLVYEEDIAETNEKLKSYLNGQAPIFEVEQRLKTKTGELKWIHTRGKAIALDESGNPLRMTGTHTDITKRKQAEEALRESEEHFRALFEKAPLGYQSLDENACFIDINEAWLDIMGYTREEVIGKWFGEFMTPECKEMVKERFPMFKAIGKVHTEFEMIKKNGTIANVIFDGRIGHNSNGEFKQTHCILQEVTEYSMGFSGK